MESNDATLPPGERRYAVLVLIVLTVVYVLNFIDRQILSVLAESIKADLGISDADIGFLFGTAFAVFYSVLGIPLGKLADGWNRTRLISIGLAVWSLMTALSGFAQSFVTLALCRFGVGAGEASASPASYTILYDYFPARVRTTVLALYSTGNFIGQGIGIFLGGYLLSIWAGWYPDPSVAPLGLRGWQAAFLAVGLPGLVMALVVLRLREPLRGAADGIVAPAPPHPVRDAWHTLLGMLPGGATLMLARAGANRAQLFGNIFGGLAIAAAGWVLIAITGNFVQWVALGFGLYAVLSWSQNLALRDRVSFGLIFCSPTLLWAVIGVAATNFMINSISFWSIPYYQRQFGVDVADLGLVIGLAAAIGGLVGVVAGGLLADRLRARTPAGKLVVVLVSLVTSMISSIWLLTAPTLQLAYIGSFALAGFAAMGLGPAVSTINDLVLPRVRASATAFGFMTTYLVAGAIGPYLIGVVSDGFVATGAAPGNALRQAMLWSLIIPAGGVILVFAAIRAIAQQEDNLVERARAFGEAI